MSLNQQNPKFKDPRLYIMYYLFANNGDANLLHLDGRNFSGENQRLSTIDDLEKSGSISKTPGGFRLSYYLTDKGRHEFFERTLNACLQELNKEQDNFHAIESILPRVGIAQFDPALSEAIIDGLESRGLVFFTEEGGVMINEAGRSSVRLMNLGIGHKAAQTQPAVIHNEGIMIQGSTLHHSDLLQRSNKETTRDTSTEISTTDPSVNLASKKPWISREILINTIFSIIAAIIAGYFIWKLGWTK